MRKRYQTHKEAAQIAAIYKNTSLNKEKTALKPWNVDVSTLDQAQKFPYITSRFAQVVCAKSGAFKPHSNAAGISRDWCISSEKSIRDAASRSLWPGVLTLYRKHKTLFLSKIEFEIADRAAHSYEVFEYGRIWKKNKRYLKEYASGKSSLNRRVLKAFIVLARLVSMGRAIFSDPMPYLEEIEPLLCSAVNLRPCAAYMVLRREGNCRSCGKKRYSSRCCG